MGLGAAIIAGWTAIGAATIGTIAVGAILQGAIIGAAIGGLSAAVTGGSIGKGMLFGAVGGAVAGGISGYLGGAGGSVGGSTTQVATGTGGMGGTGGGSFQIAGTNMVGAGGAVSGGSTAGSSISATLGDIGTEVLAQGAVAGIEGYMEAEAGKEAQEAADRAATVAHERNKETMRLASELSGGPGGGGGGTDNTAAQLAYDARMAELDQRKTEFGSQTDQTRLEWDTEMDRRAQRRALFSGSSTGEANEAAAVDNSSSLLEKRQEKGMPETALTPPVPQAPPKEVNL